MDEPVDKDGTARRSDAPVASVTMADDGRIVAWNTQAERLFGWTHDEAIGQDLADLLIPEPYRSSHRLGLRRFLELGDGPLVHKSVTLTSQHRTLGYIEVEVTITPRMVEGHYQFTASIRRQRDKE